MQQTTLYMLFALFFAGFALLFFLSLTTGTADAWKNENMYVMARQYSD